MRRAPRYSISASDFAVREVKVLRRQSLAWRLVVDSKKLRKREQLPADLFSRLIVPPAQIAIRHFSAQHAPEMGIPPAEFRCAAPQSLLRRNRDRRERAAAILTEREPALHRP